MKNRSRTGWRIGVFSAAAAVCMMVTVTGCSGKQESTKSAGGQQVNNSSEETAGQPVLQSFQAKTLEGGTFTQEDLAKKDVTVINFWSVQCGPCIVEMPDIADFAKSLPEHVQVLTVCLDGERDLEGAKDILADAGFEGTTLLSGDGDFQSLCGEIMYTPTTIVVDGEGNIIGDALIGGQEDVADTYLAMINHALESMGKAAISHEEN